MSKKLSQNQQNENGRAVMKFWKATGQKNNCELDIYWDNNESSATPITIFTDHYGKVNIYWEKVGIENYSENGLRGVYNGQYCFFHFFVKGEKKGRFEIRDTEKVKTLYIDTLH